MDAPAKAAAALRILTVEDSPLIITRLHAIISDIGDVKFVGNAASMMEALILIEKQQPDVLFLDIRLGPTTERTGIDLLSVVNTKYPSITVVMLTNISGERYRAVCERNGADFFLDKSEDFNKIPETLNQIMHRR